MNILFWVCFGVGVGYTVLAFLLGEAVGFFDFATDFDIGGLSPLKPSVLAAFVTVFGASGLLLQNIMSLYVTLPLAGVLGAAVAGGMYRFVIVPLTKAQNTSAVEIQSLVGCEARVSEKIFQGGYGQITYTVNGNTYSAPARAEGGGEILRGEHVEITHIEENTYYVRTRF